MNAPYRATFALARDRLIHGSLLAGFLCLGGLWLLLGDPDAFEGALPVGGVLLLVGFGLGTYQLRQTRQRQARLIIDENGVWYFDWGLPSVPWHEIGEVYQKGSKIRGYLALQLSDGNHFMDRHLSDEQRKAVNFGALVRPGLLLIPNGALEGSLKDLETAVLEGKRAYGL